MATLYINFKANKHSPTGRGKEAMTTSTSKATSGISTGTALSTLVELYSTAAHLVHISGSPDADSANAFYLFPNEPCRVECGPGCEVSAKSLA